MAARLRSTACGRSSTHPRHSHNKDVYCFDHYSLLKEREGKRFRFKSKNRTQVLVRQLMSWHILTLEYSSNIIHRYTAVASLYFYIFPTCAMYTIYFDSKGILLPTTRVLLDVSHPVCRVRVHDVPRYFKNQIGLRFDTLNLLKCQSLDIPEMPCNRPVVTFLRQPVAALVLQLCHIFRIVYFAVTNFKFGSLIIFCISVCTLHRALFNNSHSC